jgi:hypothetical protein
LATALLALVFRIKKRPADLTAGGAAAHLAAVG